MDKEKGDNLSHKMDSSYQVTSKHIRPAISFILHAHQPLGDERHEGINKKIYERCYLPNSALHNFCSGNNSDGSPMLSSNGKMVGATLNVSGSVLLDLLAHQDEELSKKVLAGFRQAANDSINNFGITNLMLQGSLFHSIIPLLSKESSELQYEWSRIVFDRALGRSDEKKPLHSGIWLPELAYDSKSLDMIAQKGEWAPLPQWSSPGTDTSLPHIASTSKGDIPVVLYDKYLSDQISFRGCGWDFWPRIRGHNHYAKQGWPLAMDLETFGEHGRDDYERSRGPWWLNDLIYHQIPGEGYNAVPAQLIAHNGPSTDRITLNPTGSWSCLCEGSKESVERLVADLGKKKEYSRYLSNLPDELNGLLRWCAPCGCVYGPYLSRGLWKLPFRSSLRKASEGLRDIYEDFVYDYIDEPDEALASYLDMKLDAIMGIKDIARIREFIDTNFRDEMVTDDNVAMALYLMDGIYLIEAAQTSCATFWESPDRIEPWYNVVHAGNAFKSFEKGLSYVDSAKFDPTLDNLKYEVFMGLSHSSERLGKAFKDASETDKYTEHCHANKIYDLY